MSGVNYYTYWIAKKRYKVDRDFAMELYDRCNGDFDKLSVIIGSNSKSVEEQYRKLWL